ncbi:unnamed protein product [Zymoseptoria tritici ST99CH_1A5]|nr:unnamed protein product [Zymoseptoria tritici ST99CH_1A5]
MKLTERLRVRVLAQEAICGGVMPPRLSEMKALRGFENDRENESQCGTFKTHCMAEWVLRVQRDLRVGYDRQGADVRAEDDPVRMTDLTKRDSARAYINLLERIWLYAWTNFLGVRGRLRG